MDKQLTLGSLFDGSGGFPLAGQLNGVKPVWASEIEPYPLKVTAARFPDMIQLGDIMKTGVLIDATVSTNLIKNIFFNKAALHDGAMIVSDYRIAAAGCFLPLTQNAQISKDKGTRHRAGVGMSEVSDAVVVIVSEETGEISLAVDGKLIGGQNYTTLRQTLTGYLLGDMQGKKKRRRKNKVAEDAINGDN